VFRPRFIAQTASNFLLITSYARAKIDVQIMPVDSLVRQGSKPEVECIPIGAILLFIANTQQHSNTTGTLTSQGHFLLLIP